MPYSGADEELTAKAQAIDALLPQTQCGKCGFSGCMPYAQAMAAGTSPINRCPPGGAAGIAKLAALLQVEPIPLDTTCGEERPPVLALIDEARCIGCTLCINACPVDAIVGAPKKMHTVLLAHCTGCELCLPPCPVDCIGLVSVETLANKGVSGALLREGLPSAAAAEDSRRRYLARQSRLERLKEGSWDAEPRTDDAKQLKRAAVAQAMERARARRGPGST
ncbi:MAG: RnfABCDGE type electron transport complex subunit B [Betaproteobacteria bacterium]|nr:RnfABCDGE type electron transport complex subunit B [Betaproteobacteria bacterium]